ncbi:copper chaperone PCu(A)C [Consotaella salsifontis]|uniref:Copper(I)-binding protein n=1 Tax=Consotaella salsifontis TaxID=1365950 RepID=A0A1T4SWR7_9HYPH|nr:copper chaperone PCu(A)C [Consotaella salsifontis]SKA32705.1 hypothetical protein SAMN05428963_11538 [Consotaella salsifontis]
MTIAKTIFLGAALALASTAASAHDYKVGSLHIVHPWARATAPSAEVGGAYMTIENKGKTADRLLGGSTPIAEKAEVHTMEMVDGVMKMHEVDGGLEIPAGGEASLAPGGYHVMIVGLKQPLKEGERVPLTLKFEKAGSVDVELAIEAFGAKESGKHDHSSMDKSMEKKN